MMKVFTLLLLFPFGIISALHAQIQAGVIGDLEYTATSIALELLDNPFNNFEELADSIDVSGDGVDDLVFHITLSNVPDFVGSVANVSSLDPNVEIMTDPYFVTQLQLNDPILPDSTWSTDYGWPLSASFYGIAGLTQYGQWLDSNTGYMAFRVIEPTDTLYGWLEVYAETAIDSVKLKVAGYAVESVINGVEEVFASAFSLFPNPAEDHIRIDGVDVQGSIQIINSMGQEVFRESIVEPTGASIELDVSGLNEGVYFVIFSSIDRVTYSPGQGPKPQFIVNRLIISR